MLTDQAKQRLESVSQKLREGVPPSAEDSMWMFRCLREVEKVPPPKPPCAPCGMRKKVLLSVIKYLPEGECGVPDSALADYMNFDIKVKSERPVIQFKFCPWCGGAIDPERGLVVTDVRAIPPAGPSAT